MGIQFYNGLSNYGQYGYHRQIPQVSVDDINKANENKINEVNNGDQIKNEAVNSQEATPSVDNRSKIAPLEDISLTFNKEEDFEYLNNDSSVKSLDMEKAISDMKKDSILQEYQYFVGSSNNLFASEDGAVFVK